jgi:hypothetical protein
LLSSLYASEIFIPSACGGKGSCGHCKLTPGTSDRNALPDAKGNPLPRQTGLSGQDPRGHICPHPRRFPERQDVLSDGRKHPGAHARYQGSQICHRRR